MIDIKSLKKTDKGKWVLYYSRYKREKGRIKSWNEENIFVVYDCAEEGDNYMNYIGAATSPNDLIFI